MAAAEVGDDVYGEDPTVNLLERRAARCLAARPLCLCHGTMGNQIAIRLHTQPGQEVIAESRAHILDWEMATTAVFSGCLVRAVVAERGILTWKHIEPAITGRGAFRAATGLIEIENTANLAGGTVTPLPVLEEIGWARRSGSSGSPGWSADFQCGCGVGCGCEDADERIRYGDVLPVKGLGAPVGSMLTGSAEQMERARIFRKALGGGCGRRVCWPRRTDCAGARAGRLHEDHANARLLAEALSNMEGVEIELDSVETNIVVFSLTGGRSAAELANRLKARGVLMSAVGKDTIRLVTHLDVDRAACVAAAEALGKRLTGTEQSGSPWMTTWAVQRM